MEKSRAIELLKLAVPIKALTHQEFSDFVEAVNMGMDALEQPTSPDTIDRKAALDALRRCQTYLYDARDPELKIELSSAEAAINNLPTIQPEKAQLFSEGTTSDTISRQAAIDAIEKMNIPEDMCVFEILSHIEVEIATLPTIQPVATDTNVGATISKFIDGLEEIFADLRERHVDDSVCGLCEYDGAYIGQSGDWCNECPGFDRDDCFKLSDETRKEWTEEIIKALPTVQPEKAQLLKESTTSDLISRTETIKQLQGVLDVTVPITDYDGGFVDGVEVGISTVSTMPTIQPQSTTGQLNDGARSTAQSTDLIDRGQAIEKFAMTAPQMSVIRIYEAVAILESMPTIQPEPKEGHWIDKGWNGDWAWQIDGRGNCWRVIECSECGKSVLVESNYCPHCGAKMKGERQK